MPTLNKYEQGDGYYIRARPSDAGNITYKIKESGYPVVEKHGLADGEEIAWSTIQSLKYLGIIYTDQSGTLGPDDFNPDPEQLKKTEISESEAEELFSILTNHFEMSHEHRTEIREILGLSDSVPTLETIADHIETHLNRLVEMEKFPVRTPHDYANSEDTSISTRINDIESKEHDRSNLHIDIFTADTDRGDYYTDHCIHLCEKHGLEHWHIRIEKSASWQAKSIGVKQKSLILPKLIEEFPSSRYELGDPAETLSPTIENGLE